MAPPGRRQEKPQAPQVSSLSVAGNLMVEVPSIRLVAAAMNAASAAGATSVNANAGKGGPQFGATQPSAADLAKARHHDDRPDL